MVYQKFNNTVVDSFSTVYKGMGIFVFKPSAGEHYTATWTDDNGEIHSTSIPDAKTNGLVLHADPYNNEQIHYKLRNRPMPAT